MKKIYVILLAFIMLYGCNTVIYESRSNLVTKISDKGIFITTEEYLQLIDKRGINKPSPIPQVIGKYYIPEKYFIIKEDGKVYLNVPNEINDKK